VTVASYDKEAANKVQKMVSSNRFRIYTSGDVLGVEIAGALKNVYAIGAGIVEGIGFGYNTKTALVTRGTMVKIGEGIDEGK
jgi:glycerol-3-phosphate dehydrogenase (NAD(P)+)